MQKQQAEAMEMTKSQYEQRLAESRVAHKEELRASTKRHQEQLDSALSVIKKPMGTES
jgi:hypothetical protein